MKNKSNPLIIMAEFILKAAVFTSAFGGVYLQAIIDGGFFKPKIYLYFTIISNTGIAIISFVMLIIKIAELISKRQLTPKWLYTLKYMITAALFTTLVVAFAILAPAIKNMNYIFTPKNILAHLLAPLFATMDFLLFDKGYVIKRYSAFQSLVLPGLFTVITLLLSIKGVYYTNGTSYPYFFFNYRELGWFTLSAHGLGTAWWFIIIAVITILSSLILLKIKKKISRQKTEKA